MRYDRVELDHLRICIDVSAPDGCQMGPAQDEPRLPLFGRIAYGTTNYTGAATKADASLLRRFGVVGKALPVDDDAGLVAQNPAVLASTASRTVNGVMVAASTPAKRTSAMGASKVAYETVDSLAG